ncbi:MAG: hypothetical protein AAFX10_17350, partial [Pseudomonadota bacterium]
MRRAAYLALPLLFAACAAPVERSGTLAELESVEPDVEEVYLADSLERAADSYRRYLNETRESELTPEAMRRLADLQLEREYGVMVGVPRAETATAAERQPVEMAAPEAAGARAIANTAASSGIAAASSESEQDFETRAAEQEAQTGRSLVAMADLARFVDDRLKVLLRDRGIRHDVIDAVAGIAQRDVAAVRVRKARARALR